MGIAPMQDGTLTVNRKKFINCSQSVQYHCNRQRKHISTDVSIRLRLICRFSDRILSAMTMEENVEKIQLSKEMLIKKYIGSICNEFHDYYELQNCIAHIYPSKCTQDTLRSKFHFALIRHLFLIKNIVTHDFPGIDLILSYCTATVNKFCTLCHNLRQSQNYKYCNAKHIMSN